MKICGKVLIWTRTNYHWNVNVLCKQSSANCEKLILYFEAVYLNFFGQEDFCQHLLVLKIKHVISFFIKSKINVFI